MTIYSLTKNPVNSFGRVAYSLVECLRRLGYSSIVNDDPKLKYDIAVDGTESEVTAKHLVTFWETTELKPRAVARLQRRRSKLIVTCKFTQDVLKSHGLRSTIIPLAAEYQPVPLPALAPFTFYTIYQDGGYWERKRTQDIVDAFELAFKRTHGVRLVIKQGSHCKILETFDRRIEIIRDYLPDISHIHRNGHIFVSACGAEGWGYPHHDAMAFGRPVICQKIGGPIEFLDDSCAWFLKPYMHRAPNCIFYEGYGKIGRVNIKELAATMRYAFDNQDQVMEKSTNAFVRARSFTLDQMTVAVKKAFDL